MKLISNNLDWERMKLQAVRTGSNLVLLSDMLRMIGPSKDY